jgi:hypothetical protein
MSEPAGNPCRIEGDQVQVYDGRWRVVGRIVGDELHCKRSEDVHMWLHGLEYDVAKAKRMRHWAVDRRALSMLSALGVTRVVIQGEDATYTAPLADFWKGEARDFGHGVQLFLRESHFHIEPHDAPFRQPSLL